MDTVVSPDTLLRWYRRLIVEKWNFVHRRGPGRPAIMQQISALIVRMAQDNPGPGLGGAHRRAPTVVNTRCCADRIEGASAGGPGRTADAASRLPASNSGVTRSGRRRGGPRLTEVNDDIVRRGASLMNAMLRISPPHAGQTSGSLRAQ
jgi:hypothetical protein